MDVFLMCLVLTLHGALAEIDREVSWASDEIAIFASEQNANLVVTVSNPDSRDLLVDLASYAVGLTIGPEIGIPENVMVLAGTEFAFFPVNLSTSAVKVASDEGYREAVIKMSGVSKGAGDLDTTKAKIYVLDETDQETGPCRVGSFRQSTLHAPEYGGPVNIQFIMNKPFSEDFTIAYRIVPHEHTASLGDDFQIKGYQDGFTDVTIPAGDTVADISIQIFDDDVMEETFEQFSVELDVGRLMYILKPLITTVTVNIVDNDACPDETKHMGRSCYYRVGNKPKTGPPGPPLDFMDARQMCVDTGGYLAVIKSELENIIASSAGDGMEAWIGLQRDTNDSANWIWMDTDTANYTGWRKNEPNNRVGNENCVKTNYVKLGFWNDTPCVGDRRVYYAICEKPVASIPV